LHGWSEVHREQPLAAIGGKQELALHKRPAGRSPHKREICNKVTHQNGKQKRLFPCDYFR
jgi:hypothetical protein